MRVLHVVPTYLPAQRYGGPIVSVHGLCRAIAALGHEVHVFTTNVDGPRNSTVPLETAVEIDGVKVWYFPVPAMRRLYWSPAMKHALRRGMGGFDILHNHSVFLWPTSAAARVARAEGVPYLVSPRGMLVEELVRRKSRWLKSAWISTIERRNLEAADAIHVTSAGEAEDLARFSFRLKRVVEIPNGVALPDTSDDPELERAHAGNTGPATVLFLGRINWKKGLDRLIRALALVPDAELHIVGNDDESYTEVLRRIAAEAGVLARIRFAGPAYGAEKWRALASATCFVLPSFSENFGNAVLEAMAVGCPVVVTPGVGLSEVVRRTGAGLVVENEPAALAVGLNQLLADHALRRTMGENGKKVASDDFGWHAIAARMVSVYESLLR